MSLYKCLSDSLFSCKDRASERHRPSTRKKKTSCVTFNSFFTTLVATRRRRCLLRSAWVNVMPEWLLSVISGILAGGIPGFRIELCCFFHPLAWPLGVALCCLFCFIFGGHTQDDTQDVIVYLISQSWQLSHFSVLCGFGFCVFVCLVCVLCLMGPLTGLCTGPLPVLF